MIRVLTVRLLDALARCLRSLADTAEHRGTRLYRAHSRAEAKKAQWREDRAKVERVISESQTPSAFIGRRWTDSPTHRDR